jgi:YVTN family beta-propeller protein
MHRLWFTADHTVNVLDEATGRIVRVIPVGLAPTRVAIDERLGRVFVTNQNDNTVRMVDERAGVVLRTIAVGMTPSTVAVDAATGPVFVVNAADGTLSVLDARRGIVLRTVRLGGQRPQPLTDTNATDLMVDEHAARAFVIDGSPFVIDGRTVDSRGNPAPALLVGSGLSPHQPRAPPPRRRRQYRPPLRRPDPAHRRGTRLVRQC